MCLSCDKNLTIKLDCGHECCYFCLKYNNKYNKNIICSMCKLTTYKNINNINYQVVMARRLVWLYSARHKGYWWCYDEITSKKIDVIFGDYTKRKNLKDNLLSNVNKLDTNIFVIDIPAKHNSSTNAQICNTKFSANYDLVCFDDTDDKSDSDNNLNINSIEQLEYTIDISGTKYFIDFENNCQRNCDDSSKIRELTKIIIPDTINTNDIVTYLKTINVIGIGGIKFD
jgi:hypothetical protein